MSLISNNPFYINCISNNKYLCIYLYFPNTKELFFYNFTIEELMQINQFFSSFNSIDDIFINILNFIDANIHNIILLKKDNNTIEFECENFHDNKSLSFNLYKANFFECRMIILNNNHYNLLKKEIFSHLYLQNSNSNFNTTKLSFDYINKLLVFLLLLGIILIFLLIGMSISSFSFHNLFNEKSSIINRKDIKLISNWISLQPPFQYDLLYRASRDGDCALDFHKKVDEKTPTITIISTIDGWIFGGYTDAKWESIEHYQYGYEEYKSSKNTFLFSLNKHKKYPIKEEFKHTAIYSQWGFGPSFGLKDIRISFNCFKTESKCELKSFDNYNEQNELNGGKNTFIVKEIEVYLVKMKR